MVRRRRVVETMSRTTEQYQRRLADFHAEESQRRSTLAHELKDHILAVAFPPLQRISLPQVSTYTLTSAPSHILSLQQLQLQQQQQQQLLQASTYSVRQLSKRNKCHSVSHLDSRQMTSVASPYRLLANRGGSVVSSAATRTSRIIPPTPRISLEENDFTLNENMANLPNVTEADLREILEQLLGEDIEGEENDLAHLLQEGLDQHNHEASTEAFNNGQVKRRSRLFSSPCTLAFGPTTATVSVATNTTICATAQGGPGLFSITER